MNVLEAIARMALAQPDQDALIVGDRVLSYGALIAKVGQLAGGLSEAGVARGDVVAIVAPGLIRHVLLTLAIAHLGAVSIPLLPKAGEGENEEIAGVCGVGFLVHHQGEGFRIEAPSIRKQISLTSLNAMSRVQVPPMVRTQPDELWRIGLSSGTTGRPKAITFTHQSMIVRANLIRTMFPSVPGERTMVLLDAGLQFAVGYWVRTLICGGAVVGPESSPAANLESLRKHRVCFLVTSPANAVSLAKLAQAANLAGAGPSTDLKTVCVGGSSVSPAAQEAIRLHLGADLAINYGVTEVGLVAVSDTQLQRNDLACAGRLLPWVEAQAVDEDGAVMPAGSRGLLRLRSPHMATGYMLEGGEVGGVEFRDGWFYTSDVGSVTSDGRVFLGGREGELLNLSGVKIDPVLVEAVIDEDPAILESVAVAAPDKMGQLILMAVVVGSEAIDKDRLRERCLAKLGRARVPKVVIQVDALPRNAGGKVMRDEVLKSLRNRPAPGSLKH